MNERFLDQAERAVEAERARAVQQVTNAVAGAGRKDCRDCGDEIEPKRRAAAPFAVRCVACQQVAERAV
ncbi:TraR/DksA C4-type zinc finger protein [Leisingera sp. MMG026]|uniref:TraR/DksA C4-type zinc finger protein n=1 Tax=Leisingera sp. MMG026 TaxID=2909982 RepID=UPI001F2C4D33|nr:TraR/DksA C4-type zinc finger protein [Leisingera sp. MMG026]MCF6432631.1 TraR/DksA C4-type zinc finger protein [Leisingera sp. MMG026]